MLRTQNISFQPMVFGTDENDDVETSSNKSKKEKTIAEVKGVSESFLVFGTTDSSIKTLNKIIDEKIIETFEAAENATETQTDYRRSKEYDTRKRIHDKRKLKVETGGGTYTRKNAKYEHVKVKNDKLVAEAKKLSEKASTMTEKASALKASKVGSIAKGVNVAGKLLGPAGTGLAISNVVQAETKVEKIQAGADLVVDLVGYTGPAGTAFSAGYGIGQMADQGIGALSKSTIGMDLSPSTLSSDALHSIDKAISKKINDDPDDHRTLGYRFVSYFNL